MYQGNIFHSNLHDYTIQRNYTATQSCDRFRLFLFTSLLSEERDAGYRTKDLFFFRACSRFLMRSFETRCQVHFLLKRPIVFPATRDAYLCIRKPLSLYPNCTMSGLSERRPSFLWFPKYSSRISWRNLSERTYSTPSLSKYWTHSMRELDVI